MYRASATEKGTQRQIINKHLDHTGNVLDYSPAFAMHKQAEGPDEGSTHTHVRAVARSHA